MRPLFKPIFVDFPTTEYSRNFPKDPGDVTLIQTSVRRLKLWDFLSVTKDSFFQLRKHQFESPELKKLSSLCSGRTPVFSHVS